MIKKIITLLSFVTFGTHAMFIKNPQPPKFLYKIVSLANWEESKKKSNLVLTDMDAQFIHFSTNKRQIDYVVDKFWKNKPYVLFTINTQKIPGTYKLEDNSSKTDRFWHLYNGSIPHTAIEKKEIIKP